MKVKFLENDFYKSSNAFKWQGYFVNFSATNRDAVVQIRKRNGQPVATAKFTLQWNGIWWNLEESCYETPCHLLLLTKLVTLYFDTAVSVTTLPRKFWTNVGSKIPVELTYYDVDGMILYTENDLVKYPLLKYKKLARLLTSKPYFYSCNYLGQPFSIIHLPWLDND